MIEVVSLVKTFSLQISVLLLGTRENKFIVKMEMGGLLDCKDVMLKIYFLGCLSC